MTLSDLAQLAAQDCDRWTPERSALYSKIGRLGGQKKAANWRRRMAGLPPLPSKWTKREYQPRKRK